MLEVALNFDWVRANPKLSWNPDNPTPYEDFRTGLTFAEVKQCLWVPLDDSSLWQYRRRHAVMGAWRMLKRQAYEDYCDMLKRIPQEDEEVPF